MEMSIFLQFQKSNWMAPFSQFGLDGYYTPFGLDITKQSGGLLVYIKSLIPSRQLSYESICDSIFHLRSI